VLKGPLSGPLPLLCY